MKVVVQKFGGTCVESEENQLLSAERIMEAKDRGIYPVVVVSAMGRQGQPYSTVELVRTVSSIHPDIHPRELDLLMSCGEIISTVAMAHLLRSRGYETIALSGGQAGLITDEYFGHAHIIRIAPHLLLAALQDGYIVFVAGFQGNTEDHQITTLGAGGSDYTAVALTRVIQETPALPFGEVLDVEPLQVFKEVSGIMTANPDSLEAADGPPRTIENLSYDECVAMSRLGAQVLQQQAAEMAREHRIPLVVKTFRNPDSTGTEVGGQPTAVGTDRATAIVDQSRLLTFELGSEDPRLALQIDERLQRERLTYYQVSTEAACTRFAVLPPKYRDAEAIVHQVLAARGVSADEINAGKFALVSVVGEALRRRPGAWPEEAQRVLADAGVEVHGAARDDISLSYLVPDPQRKKAVSCLHQNLVL